MDDIAVDSQQVQQIFLVCKMAWYAFWLTEPPIRWVLQALSSILKPLGYDASYFPLCTGTPLLYSVTVCTHTHTPVLLPCTELKSLNLHAKWQTTLQRWYKSEKKQETNEIKYFKPGLNQTMSLLKNLTVRPLDHQHPAFHRILLSASLFVLEAVLCKSFCSCMKKHFDPSIQMQPQSA